MVICSKDFFEKMLEFFPSAKKDYEESIEFNEGLLETVVMEDVFAKQTVKLLKENNNKELLKEVFSYLEDVCIYGDETLVNNISVTILEILGNDEEILCAAQKYMKPKTRQMQYEADISIGREREPIRY